MKSQIMGFQLTIPPIHSLEDITPGRVVNVKGIDIAERPNNLTKKFERPAKVISMNSRAYLLRGRSSVGEIGEYQIPREEVSVQENVFVIKEGAFVMASYFDECDVEYPILNRELQEGGI